MIATAARFILSSFVLLLAVLLSPLLFAEPAPPAPPQWSLRVLQSPDTVAVGDVVAVEIVLLRNGLPAQMAHAQPRITITDASGIGAEDAGALLVAHQPVAGERTILAQRWRAEYSAVRPGALEIHAAVRGLVEEVTPGGVPAWVEIEAEGQALPLLIALPAADGEGVGLFVAAGLALSSVALTLLVLWRRRQGNAPAQNAAEAESAAAR